MIVIIRHFCCFQDRGGCTVEDFCNHIHRSLVKDVKYVLVWGTSSRHYPQHCGLSHGLHDEDVVQIVKKKVPIFYSFCAILLLNFVASLTASNFHIFLFETYDKWLKYFYFQEKEEGGRGRFKSHSNAPARISDREKKAPLKT